MMRLTMTEHPLARAAARLLEEDITGCALLHGGDLSDAVRLRTETGRSLIAKSGPFPEREAAMLDAIRNAGADAPLPIAAAADVLVLQDLGPGAAPSVQSWRHLGESLRRLHATSGPAYGWDVDYAFGKVAIRNGWRDSWPAFWTELRLLADPGSLPPDLVDRLRRIQERIEGHLPLHPPPSLLHGDLWAGNVHFDDRGGAWLMDPASYHGHAEVDLAMLTLFGSPADPFWEAYGRRDEGWSVRQAIYQLWPALVHLRLFGTGYRPMVERLLSKIP